MVASDSAAASRVGEAVLRSGGNAIDAAVATSFALAVTRPQSTGLGGGGFLLYRRAEDGAIFVLDFRECAPAAADAEMFQRARRHQEAEGPAPSRFGYLAVAVPGMVAGMTEAHQRWGSKPLSELLYGAVLLARDGFAADEAYVKACRDVLIHYERYPSLKATCGYVWRSHLRSGDPPKVGDIIRTPSLASLLERIGAEGWGGFYGGSVARELEECMAEHGGLITREDLSQYQVKDREPIRIKYRRYEIVSMPPPSSGGICLAEIMNILERFDLAGIGEENSTAATHLIAEAFKHAFADRARWLGDTDFVRVPVDWLTSPEYAGSIAARISLERTSVAREYGLAPPPADAGTSHFCVVDPQGNCVVATETINTEFGSLAAVERWGLILNNEMDDFSAEPGKPNAYGLRQSRRNAVQPGKRPLSSMSPTIVLKDGRPVLLLGASGGPRIISSVANVLINVLDYEMELGDAMEAVRLHHQWLPDEVYFDRAPPGELARGLRSLGHSVSRDRKTGIVQAILLRKGKLIGASDPRKGGRPAGW
jgi:gamma-glutamyltranspeptidase/glutathione hydrolase